MKKEDIVIGTTYRIREWEDMVKEFKMIGDHAIETRKDLAFVSAMKGFCGQQYTPTGIDPDECLVPEVGGWSLCAEMLEPLRAPVGMYGETPRVKIGKFSICRQDDSSVWIQLDDAEGFQLPDGVMEAHMQEIFDKHF